MKLACACKLLRGRCYEQDERYRIMKNSIRTDWDLQITEEVLVYEAQTEPVVKERLTTVVTAMPDLKNKLSGEPVLFLECMPEALTIEQFDAIAAAKTRCIELYRENVVKLFEVLGIEMSG
jgi:hypothetical protein